MNHQNQSILSSPLQEPQIPAETSIISSSDNQNDPKALASMLSGEKIDNFLKILAKFVYSKNNKNIEIVSCFYSFGIPRRNLRQNFLIKTKDPKLILVPIIFDYRYSLAVFYLSEDKKIVEYYDSLKLIKCDSFFAVKNAMEKEFNIIFGEVSQDEIYDTINDNSIYEFADYHICRIAEEICFHGKNSYLNPFDIQSEIGRIKAIMEMGSTNSKWKDLQQHQQWIPTLQFQQAKTFRQSSNGNGNFKAFEFSFIPPQPFKHSYPIIGTFLTQYLEYVKRWEANRGPTCILVPSINWSEFYVLQKRNISEICSLIKNFAFLKTLALGDQEILLKHFELPFILFERIFYSFYTSNNNNNNNSNNFVYLFNGNYIDLTKVTSKNIFHITFETANAQKAFISYWKKIMDEIRNFDLHLIEGMYIFFTLLWNIQYLDDPISKEGEAVVRRGRFLLNSEMQKFYGNDRIKCQRLFYLKDICQIIEDGTRDCKILQ